LIQAILSDLSLPYVGRSEQEARLALTDFLLVNFCSGKKTVLVVDEAQHLGPDLLEELRLLGNLEARQGKAVQIVLSAQPTLFATLGREELSSLSQRLAIRAAIEPLNVTEAADYLVQRIRTAGGQPDDVLTEEARELLARGTRGIPRLLNQAAHEALTLAYTGEVKPADAEAALEALTLLGLEVPEDQTKSDTADSTLALPEAA
jgi:type II secretory pathway predicted ATPase ExeA